MEAAQQVRAGTQQPIVMKQFNPPLFGPSATVSGNAALAAQEIRLEQECS